MKLSNVTAKAALLAAFLLNTITAVGQITTTTAASTTQSSDPLAQCLATFLGKQSLQADMVVTRTVTVAGKITESTASTAKLWIKRPNMSLFLHQQPTGAVVTYCNGTSVTTFRPYFKALHAMPLEPGDGNHLRLVEEAITDLPPSFFANDPKAELAGFVFNGEVQRVQNVPVYQYSRSKGNRDDCIFLVSNPNPLPARTITVIQENSTSGPVVHQDQVQYMWNLGLDLNPVTFEFHPPAETVAVQERAELLGTEYPPLPVGQLAPAVSMPMTTTGTLDISAERGHNALVLDFFVLKCVGCQNIMTTLTQVAHEFEPKGVRVIPVAVKETKEDIDKFFAEHNLSIPVAIDSDGSVSSAFRVQKVPHTIIVDKAGKVHSVHIGLTPTYEEDLRADLKRLLSQ